MQDTPSLENASVKPTSSSPESKDLSKFPPPPPISHQELTQELKQKAQESKEEKRKLSLVNMSRPYASLSVAMGNEAKISAGSPFESKPEFKLIVDSASHSAADIRRIAFYSSNQKFAIRPLQIDPQTTVRAKINHEQVSSVVDGRQYETILTEFHADGSGSSDTERVREQGELLELNNARIADAQAALKKQAAAKQQAEIAKKQQPEEAIQQAEQKTESGPLVTSSDTPTEQIPTAFPVSTVTPTQTPAEIVIPLDFLYAADINIPPFRFRNPRDANSEIILNPAFVEVLERVFPGGIYNISLSPEAVLKMRGAMRAGKSPLSIFNPQVGKNGELVLDMKCVLIHIKLDPITGEPLHGVTHVITDEHGEPKVVVNQDVLKKRLLTPDKIIKFGPASKWLDHFYAISYVNGVKYLNGGKMSVLGIKAFLLAAEKFEACALDNEGNLTPAALDAGIDSIQALSHLLNDTFGLGLLSPGEVVYAEVGTQLSSRMSVNSRHTYLKEKKEKSAAEKAEFAEIDALITASKGKGEEAEQAAATIAARDAAAREAVKKALIRWFSTPQFGEMQRYLLSKLDQSPEGIEDLLDLMCAGKGLDDLLKLLGGELNGGYLTSSDTATNVSVNWSQAIATADAVHRVRQMEVRDDINGSVQVDKNSPIVVIDTESHIAPTSYCYFVTVPECGETDPLAIQSYINQYVETHQDQYRTTYQQANRKAAGDSSKAMYVAIRYGSRDEYYCYCNDGIGGRVFQPIQWDSTHAKAKPFKETFAKDVAKVERLELEAFNSTKPLEYIEEQGSTRLKGSKDEHYDRCLQHALQVELLTTRAEAANAEAQEARATLEAARKASAESNRQLVRVNRQLVAAKAKAEGKSQDSPEQIRVGQLVTALEKASTTLTTHLEEQQKAEKKLEKLEIFAKETRVEANQAEENMRIRMEDELEQERATVPDRIAKAQAKRDLEKAKRGEKRAERAKEAAEKAAKKVKTTSEPTSTDSSVAVLTTTSSSTVATTTVPLTTTTTSVAAEVASPASSVATSSSSAGIAEALGSSFSTMFVSTTSTSASSTADLGTTPPVSSMLGASMASGGILTTTITTSTATSSTAGDVGDALAVTIHGPVDDSTTTRQDGQPTA